MIVHATLSLLTSTWFLSEHRTTRSLHLSRSLAILRAPSNTHLFEFFFESASPCLLRPPPLSSVVFWHPVHCCMFGTFYMQEDVASHFPSPCSDNVLESLHACHQSLALNLLNACLSCSVLWKYQCTPK